MKIRLYIILLFLFFITGSVWAQSSFVVKNIDVRGLHRLSPETVESYLPVKRGQVLQPAKTPELIRALYKTGFFDQVKLSREGSTLVVRLVERPTIGDIKMSGNSVVPTDKLKSVMQSLGVVNGRVYNPVVLDRIRQSLLGQYYQLGRYNARVNIKTVSMSRNRVLVNIDISEGLVARVRGIFMIGNHVFSEKTLVKQMDLTTPGYLTLITQSDRYSEEKLASSLEKVRDYYMDRGYLKFKVISSQAQVTPDRKSVYITIVISEGQPYSVGEVKLAGDLILPRQDIMKYVLVKRGQVFSRKQVVQSQELISQVYGNKGYLFSNIAIQPGLDEKTHQVSLVFNITAGKRVYVRHITFSDNLRTNDVVLRREIQQMEAAPASMTRLEASKQRLLLLPYIKEADMAVNPVDNVKDQVDVNYRVKEDSSAQASFKLGYSQIQHLILSAGFNQKNFLGTGNTFGINFSRSEYEQFYGVDYSNPYYTEDGISRSLTFSMSRVNPQKGGEASGYTSNQLNLGVLYGIPIGQEHGAFSRALAGLSYQNILLHIGGSGVSNQVLDFTNRHGRHYQEADLKLGMARDSRDRAIFPTKGSSQSLFMDVFTPLDSHSVSFYTLNFAGRYYYPLTNQFIMTGKTNLGYGNGFHGIHDFPFFKNYYAGGIETVHGYLGNSLGLRDSNYQPFGGNILVDAGIGLIFPNYISDNLRTSAFVDAGNVYSSMDNTNFGGASTNSGPLRYAAGVEGTFLSPFGPLTFSLGWPIHSQKGDEKEVFQFLLGANF